MFRRASRDNSVSGTARLPGQARYQQASESEGGGGKRDAGKGKTNGDSMEDY